MLTNQQHAAADWYKKIRTVIALQEFIEGEVLSLQSYKEFADSFICTLIPESSSPHITYTPGGMLYKPGGSNMQHVTSISFLLLTYAKYLSKSSHTVNCGDISVGPATLQRQAKKQVGTSHTLLTIYTCLTDSQFRNIERLPSEQNSNLCVHICRLIIC